MEDLESIGNGVRDGTSGGVVGERGGHGAEGRDGLTTRTGTRSSTETGTGEH